MPPKNRHKNKNNKPATPATTTTITPSTTTSTSTSTSSTTATSAAATEVKENGHLKPVFDTKDPVILKNRGNDAFKSGNYRLAIDLFSAAIDVEPTNHVLFSNRSACHAALKEFEKALEDAELCIQAKPDWFKAYFRKGQALEFMYQYPEAMHAYRKGVELDKTDATLNKAHADLTVLLEELKMSEKQIECINNPDSDRFERMVRWLKAGGAKFPKLYLQYYSEDYRGVHCLTKIPAEDQILYVPFPLIMTSQVAMESEVGQSIIKAKVDLRSKHSYLASYLLQEKHNPNTIWKPYLDILPAHYNNMPIFFGPDKLKLLKGSFTLAKIADRIDSLRKEYDGICQLVPSFSRFTHEEFVWARLVVITRIFGLVIRGLKTDGLVPYADMLNHKKPQEVASADAASMADTKWTFDDSLNGFTITALRSIPRGEQVFDSYGRKCNSRFFVNYGFSLDDNEEDNEVVLKFSMNPADPFYSMKLRFVNGREILTRREFQIPATYRETSDREHKTKEMFSYLRFIHAKDSELMFLSGAEEFKLDDIDPLSTRNEIEVLKHVKQSALEQLAEFDDTLEHDNKLLASNTIKDSNIRNCIVMRRGEKQVLHWYIELADKCIPLLEMPWKDLKRVSAKSYQSTSAHDYYIKEIVVPLVKKSS